MTVKAVPAARERDDNRPMQLLPLVVPGTGDELDAVVRFVTDGNVTCTGTLIADDRVLTAHHCISARDARGRVLDHDVAPGDITVELGTDYLPWAEVKVRAIVAPQCGYVSGEGDIAILVLARHLIGMPTATCADSAPNKDGVVVPYGFGRCVMAREGVHLDKERPREADPIRAVSAGDFEALASICPGDSGGPVYDHPPPTKRSVIGVISAAVMDGAGNKGVSLFTRVDVWSSLFAAAQEISEGASPSELPPYGECHAPAPRPAARPPARP